MKLFFHSKLFVLSQSMMVFPVEKNISRLAEPENCANTEAPGKLDKFQLKAF